MIPLIIHSPHSGPSREFVAQYASVRVVDWFNADERKLVEDLFPDVRVNDFPSVLVDAPAWFCPPIHSDEVTVHHNSGFEVITCPETWDAVEQKIAFFDRRSVGYRDDVNIPDVENLVWGGVPTPPDGFLTVFDGWDVDGDTATTKWRFDPPPPPLPPVEVLGEE